MPRPRSQTITFTIDGREVQAPENTMLVDAAKLGDVEIPVFCYEPKLGNPVGACRMCLVEIEGIPKLQTGCSTPVKDGMVVHTQSERVREGQKAVVEFLLLNHPLDCPVCDKGGECPLQDISFGWGAGTSRFIEPKRHFRKPLELSPLIAIDRERCILCYRCVRFSQELSEDYQLVLEERGRNTFVTTFDGHPYVAPFSGNIIELCPVGALTSIPYRFRARPWDIEGAGSVCTLCPAQCNVTVTVRDERAMRLLQRDNPDVDDGWLCDKGRFGYQAIHVDERITQPLLRDGGTLRPVSWERALEAAAGGLKRGHAAALAGGGATNEEALLLGRLLREGLGSGDVDSTGGSAPAALHALLDPGLAATVSDIEFAHTVLIVGTELVDDIPILDLRVRKGVRRRRMQLAILGARPSSLDANARLSLRCAPGEETARLQTLAGALEGDAGDDELAALLRDGGEDVVIIWGSRLLHAADGGMAAAGALTRIAAALGLRDRDGAGLLGVPAHANGRGLLEAGLAPGCGPGFAAAPAGRGAREIAHALCDGDVTALYLLRTDPLLDLPDRPLWERALERASTVVAHADLLTDGIREHATVVFPAESFAEKEGTITHPDGRIQRLRPAIAHPGEVRSEWRLLVELARRAGLDLPVGSGIEATALLAAAVPFYEGLTPEEIGGRGVRWQERPAASRWPAQAPAATDRPAPQAPAAEGGGLRLGTFRSVWAAPAVAVSPSLRFLHPDQQIELAPADAARLGLGGGDRVQVSSAGRSGSVEAHVVLRDAVGEGTAFMQDGLPGSDSANALTNGGGPIHIELRRSDDAPPTGTEPMLQ